MDYTAKWMKTGGEGIPPAQGTGSGNVLGLSPQAAALAVLILLGLVLAAGPILPGSPAHCDGLLLMRPIPMTLRR